MSVSIWNATEQKLEQVSGNVNINDSTISDSETWSSEKIHDNLGDLSELKTIEKSNLVSAINEVNTKSDNSTILMDNLFIADNFTMKNTDLIKSVDNGDGTYIINTHLNSEGKFPNNTPFNMKANANKLDLYDFKGKKLYFRLDIISGDIANNWLGFIIARYKEDGTSANIYPYVSNKDIGVHQIASYNVDDIIAEGYRYIAFQPWLSNNNVYTDVVMRVVVTTKEWNYNVQDFKYTGYGLNDSLADINAKLGEKADKSYVDDNFALMSTVETIDDWTVIKHPNGIAECTFVKDVQDKLKQWTGYSTLLPSSTAYYESGCNLPIVFKEKPCVMVQGGIDNGCGSCIYTDADLNKVAFEIATNIPYDTGNHTIHLMIRVVGKWK